MRGDEASVAYYITKVFIVVSYFVRTKCCWRVLGCRSQGSDDFHHLSFLRVDLETQLLD